MTGITWNRFIHLTAQYRSCCSFFFPGKRWDNMKSRLFFIILVVWIHHRKIVANCFGCETREPMRFSWLWVNLNKWPSHDFCSFTFFPSISNYTKANIGMVETLLDPSKTLSFSHIPGTIHWNQIRHPFQEWTLHFIIMIITSFECMNWPNKGIVWGHATLFCWGMYDVKD